MNEPSGLDKLMDDFTCRRLSRRAFIQGGFALGLSLSAIGGLLAACGGEGAGSTASPTSTELTDKGPLVVVSWGGAYTEATKKFFVDPFAAETGVVVQIVDAPGTQVAQLEAQAAAGNIEWDLYDSVSGPDAAVLYDKGLIQDVPADLLDYMKQILPESSYRPDYGFTAGSLAYVLAFWKDKFPTAPTGCPDIFDTANFPGPRSLPGISVLGVLTCAQIALGTPASEVATTPIDLAAVEDLLLKAKSDVTVWWSSGDQSEQVIRDREVDLSLAWSGRMYRAAKGRDIGIVWDGSVREDNYWSLVTGTKHEQAGVALMKWILGHPENEAKWMEFLQYSFCDPRALALLDEKTAEVMVDNPKYAGMVGSYNLSWYVKNIDEVNSLYKKLLQA